MSTKPVGKIDNTSNDTPLRVTVQRSALVVGGEDERHAYREEQEPADRPQRASTPTKNLMGLAAAGVVDGVGVFADTTALLARRWNPDLIAAAAGLSDTAAVVCGVAARGGGDCDDGSGVRWQPLPRFWRSRISRHGERLPRGAEESHAEPRSCSG